MKWNVVIIHVCLYNNMEELYPRCLTGDVFYVGRLWWRWSLLLIELHRCWLVCQKQVSRAGISEYIPHYLWDIITCPWSWYLLLAHESSPLMYVYNFDQEIVTCHTLSTKHRGEEYIGYWMRPHTMSSEGRYPVHSMSLFGSRTLVTRVSLIHIHMRNINNPKLQAERLVLLLSD